MEHIYDMDWVDIELEHKKCGPLSGCACGACTVHHNTFMQADAHVVHCILWQIVM